MSNTIISADSEYSVENVTRGLTLASHIRLASNSSQRRRGLLGVTQVEPGGGIWIDPCEAVHTFGMKITLDAVFLDAGFRVKKIAAHLKPRRIALCLSARSVLELAAGASLAAATEPGDQLSFKTVNCPAETLLPADKKA